MQGDNIHETPNDLSQCFRTLNVLEDAKKHFGRQLQAARETLGYTQKDLGRLIGVDSNTVSRIERGDQGVRWVTMERIFKVLGQPPSYYFSDEAKPIEPPPPSISQALAVIQEALLRTSVIPEDIIRRLEALDPKLVGNVLEDFRIAIEAREKAESPHLPDPVSPGGRKPSRPKS